MKLFSSKGVKFSGDSIKSCVGFIDLVDSTKNAITMDNLEHIRKYYSKFINSVSENVKSYSGKVIKNIGDCLLFYFPKTTDFKDMEVFRETIDCGFKILDERYEYRITERNKYSTYNIKRKNILELNDMEISNKTSLSEKQQGSSIEDFHNKNDNKRVILVDDEQDILFTYKVFLETDYDVTSFGDPVFALNYIRNISNFNHLLIILDIRMKNLNGLQLHQKIKSIDPTIKILFVTALDILDELLNIFPGISKEQIMEKNLLIKSCLPIL